MAINLELLRSRLSNLDGKSKGADVTFKPVKGEQRIRIVPLKGSPENPFQDLHFHFKLGGKTYLSPLSYGEADPVSEFAEALITQGGMTKEEYKEVVKFRPVRRTYVPVVVRGKEEEGVKFWAFSQNIERKLLEIMNDPDYGDITDPKTGHDIKVIYTPQEDSSTNFAQTEIMPSPKQSPLTTDKALEAKLLNEQPVLMETAGKRHTYEELQAVLARVLNPESAAPSPKSSGPA
jgi:hypothetical protein